MLVLCVRNLSIPNKLVILHVLYVLYVSASETLPVVIPMSRDFIVAKKGERQNKTIINQCPSILKLNLGPDNCRSGNFELLSTRRPDPLLRMELLPLDSFPAL